MEEKKGEPKVWAEIGASKEGRLYWIEMVEIKKGSEEPLEDVLARRLDQLKKLGPWHLRTRICRFENGRNRFGDWKEV